MLLRVSLSATVAAIGCLPMLGWAPPTVAEVKVTVAHNANKDTNPYFRFKNVPTPVKDNAARKATVTLVDGEIDVWSKGLRTLNDGLLPLNQDQATANFYFRDVTPGGRFRLDLGRAMMVYRISTYSWHTGPRAPQVYQLYASDGTHPKFNPAPKRDTDPTAAGWKLIASVDSWPKQGEPGGQYGVNITDSSGSLGKFRYLLFDCRPTEIEDSFGNTFYSEINVITKK